MFEILGVPCPGRDQARCEGTGSILGKVYAHPQVTAMEITGENRAKKLLEIGGMFQTCRRGFGWP